MPTATTAKDTAPEKAATATGDSPASTGQPGEVETATEHGKTTIAETVVTKIAALAAREISGVDSLGGTISGALSGVVGRVRGAEHRTAGVGVEVGSRQAAVDLTMVVRYPFAIHEVADAVRQNVTERIEQMTGLEVVEVNIAVTDLAFDDGASAESGPTERVA